MVVRPETTFDRFVNGLEVWIESLLNTLAFVSRMVVAETHLASSTAIMALRSF
jgi:hypothetical protein